MAGPSAPYGRLTEIVRGAVVVRGRGKWLAVTSFLSFHSAGGGTWAVAGCWNDVQDSLTSVNNPDKTYPDRICRLSGCDMAVVRMWCLRVSCASPLGVRIGEACHVYSWGNPDGINPDRNVCHVSPGSVCHVSSGGGVPTSTIFLGIQVAMPKRIE